LAVFCFVFMVSLKKMINKLISYIRQGRHLLYFLLFVAVVANFSVSEINGILVFITGFIWVIVVVGFYLESRFSIIGSIIFLVISGFFVSIGGVKLAEKSAILAYVFLAVGVLWQLAEVRRRQENYGKSKADN